MTPSADLMSTSAPALLTPQAAAAAAAARIEDVGAEFMKLMRAVEPFTMVGPHRLYALHNAVKYVVANDIPGDFVECGVYRGGCCMMMALTLIQLGAANRRIHLYDTFRGMSEPTTVDVSMRGHKIGIDTWREQQAEDHNEWCYAPLAEVRRNMAATGYDPDLLVYVEGRTEDTIPGHVPDTIALLRLDTDWYESTHHELTHLYPSLVPHGVLVSDDCAHWRGHRLAIDTCFRERGIHLLLLRTACGAIAVNTAPAP